MDLHNQPKNFLPDFCAIRMVFAIVVNAELLAIVLTLASDQGMEQFWLSLSMRSLYVQWIALFSTGLLCFFKRRLQSLAHTAAGIVAWLMVLLVTLGVALVAYQLADGEYHDAGLQRILPDLLIAAIVTALVLRYLYDQYQIKRSELAESELRVQALQARIRPHFLFNSMNTIASLTRADPVLAEQVVEDLSDLFRATLGDSSRLSTIKQELELASGYLRIEQQRLGDRMTVIWDVDDLPEEVPIPALLLQPLVENAVYHGIEPALESGAIRVIGRYKNNRINLSVRNTMPKDNQRTGREGSQMALDNINRRLIAVFGEQAGLTVTHVDTDYQVRIYFPYFAENK